MNYPNYEEMTDKEMTLHKLAITENEDTKRTRAKHREVIFGYFFVVLGFAVVASLIIGIALIASHASGRGGVEQQEWRLACLEKDGSWVPVNEYDYTCILEENGIKPSDVRID